jgi:hypothetical protein
MGALMNIPSFFPVFENGQVLTSGNLNDIVSYLEPQGRLTRARLIGIGVVCGLQPDWAGGVLTLSKGVAVTSEGYLIAEDEAVFNRARPYLVPVPDNPDATPEEKAEARYPFLFDGATQRPPHELLPTDFVPAPGEPAPIALTDGFVADKTVLLFLEKARESLKSCDINDCSDKGSEMNLTLRRLLVDRATADAILLQEADIAGRPVDRANHPRRGLAPLAIPRLNLAGAGVTTLRALYSRYLGIAIGVLVDAWPAMNAAYAAYRPVLEDMYPVADFPDGPVPPHHFLPMLAHFAESPALVQHLYAAAAELVLAHNEFLEAAARLDAECAPDPARFPCHVLAGDAVPRPTAFAGAPRTLAEFAAYEPLAATTGPAPEGPPAPRRHHFVPSPALSGGHELAAEVRALFARMVLLGQTYHTRGLIGGPIRITPSRWGAAPLGERAIPAHYRFEPLGDLFRNWSWRRARVGLLATISAYALTPDGAAGHPLLLRRDEADFLRIEGVVGQPLGTAMARIIALKRELGLSFAIEPVFVAHGQEPQLDAEAQARAREALQRLLLCRMRDLDVIFLILMAGLFAFLVWLVQALARLDATRATRRAIRGPDEFATEAVARRGAFTAIRLDRAAEKRLHATSERTLANLRLRRDFRDDLVKEVVRAEDEKPLEPVAVGAIFERVRDPAAGGELIERVRVAVRDLPTDEDPEQLAQAVYPAIALMARTEDLMAAAGASSIAEFDAERFTTAVAGFTEAYDTYAARAETDPEQAGKPIAEANAAIVANRATISSAAAQFSGASIVSELGTRVQRLFAELTLPGHAARHPGHEHDGGVPRGGTFVLLYAARAGLEAGLRGAVAATTQEFARLFRAVINADPPQLAIDTMIRAILEASRPRSEDVLDDFVVLGDLYLPTMCCDSDCSELEVEARIGGRPIRPGPVLTDPEAPPRGEGTLAGTVLARRANDVEARIRNATLVLTDLATGKTEETVLPEAEFKLPLPAGSYLASARFRDRSSQEERFVLNDGQLVELRLVIG